MSPAQRHKARLLAAAPLRAGERGAAPARSRPAATAYELQLAEIGQDLRAIGAIASIEARLPLKRELLPKYDAWVDGVLSADTPAGKAAPDLVLAHVMIWRLDVGDYDQALRLADYLIRHDLPLPPRFDRTVACFVLEQIAEAALQASELGEAFDPDLLLRVEELVDDDQALKIPDQARAKLEKALGIAFQAKAEALEEGGDGPAGGKRAAIERTLNHYRRAFKLDSKSGVKTRINGLEKQLKRLTVSPPGEAGDGSLLTEATE